MTADDERTASDRDRPGRAVDGGRVATSDAAGTQFVAGPTAGGPGG